MSYCPGCKKWHSDWLSCGQAEYLQQYDDPVPERVVVEPVVPAKPVFDRSAHMAAMRERRWKRE